MDVPTCENDLGKKSLSSRKYLLRKERFPRSAAFSGNKNKQKIRSYGFSASVDDRGRIAIPSAVRNSISGEIFVGYMLVKNWNFLSGIVIGSRNRISIPSAIRKTLAINPADKLPLSAFGNCVFILKNGCGGVINSIEGCGSSGPSENPGRGPLNKFEVS